ncbi:MAG: Kelch repeat-containing protein, partial [Phycisphaerae bacterium]
MACGVLCSIVCAAVMLPGVASPASAGCVWQQLGPSFLGARKNAAAVNQNGTLVVLGGRPLVGQASTVHYLPPGATTWLSGTPIDPARNSPAAGLNAAGQIIVTGGWGFDDTGGGVIVANTGFLYDLTNGATGTLASMDPLRARAFFAFANDNLNRLYILGGDDTSGVAWNLADRYDPVTDAWTALANLPQPRSDPAAVYDGAGHVLVIGGANAAGSPQTTVFSFDIATSTWSTLAPQPAALMQQAAVLGADGRVYVVGGSAGGPGPAASVYVFDPTLTQWSTGPSLNVPRLGTAVVLGSD